MKSYLIHSVNSEGWSGLVLTKNLDKDFIKKYNITYTEEFDDDDKLGLHPYITDVRISGENDIEIYELNVDGYRQTQILSMSTFRKDYEDILSDFITDHYREIVFSDPPETEIKKFSNFK